MNNVIDYWKEGWKPLGRYIVISSLIGMSFVPLKFIAVALFVFIDSTTLAIAILGTLTLFLLPLVTKWASDSTNQLKSKLTFPTGFAGEPRE